MERSAARADLWSVTGSSASASATRTRFFSRFSDSPASRAANTSDRAVKNTSWAARNRAHSASSTSRRARPAAFHSVIRSR